MSAEQQAGTLAARMDEVAKKLDVSGEAVGAALVEFIANAMDLSELGRAVGAECDELRARSGQPAWVPPQDVQARLGGFFTVMGLDDPRGLAFKLLAAVPGEAFGPKETVLRRLTGALSGMTVEVHADHHELTGATPGSGRIVDPEKLAARLAEALGGSVCAEVEQLRAALDHISRAPEWEISDAVREVALRGLQGKA